jgi:hypothetical protein
MKTYGEMEVYLHAFLTSAHDGAEWSVSHTGHFTTKERAPGTPWTGSRVGLRADSEEKNSLPLKRIEPRSSSKIKFAQYGGETHGVNEGHL